MPRVPISMVVSFSSEDPKHQLTNLLKTNSGKKWLSAASDKSGELWAIFQLPKPTKISNLDIGTHCASSMVVTVGHSNWPQTEEFKPFLPVQNLMTPLNCRMNTNVVHMKLLKYESFDAETRDQEWDRIKILLYQPFRRDLQFGLSTLVVSSSNDEPSVETVSTHQHGREGIQSPLPTSRIRNSFSPFVNKIDPKAYELKARLANIQSSSEHGSSNAASLSRSAMLLLASTENAPKYKTNEAIGIRPMGTGERRKAKVPFEKELEIFHKSLDLSTMDLENTSFADLRHQLEKLMCRKLSKEERATFRQKTKEFLDDNDESDSVVTNKVPGDQSPGNSSLPKSPVSNVRAQPRVISPSNNGNKAKTTRPTHTVSSPVLVKDASPQIPQWKPQKRISATVTARPILIDNDSTQNEGIQMSNTLAYVKPVLGIDNKSVSDQTKNGKRKRKRKKSKAILDLTQDWSPVKENTQSNWDNPTTESGRRKLFSDMRENLYKRHMNQDTASQTQAKRRKTDSPCPGPSVSSPEIIEERRRTYSAAPEPWRQNYSAAPAASVSSPEIVQAKRRPTDSSAPAASVRSPEIVEVKRRPTDSAAPAASVSSPEIVEVKRQQTYSASPAVSVSSPAVAELRRDAVCPICRGKFLEEELEMHAFTCMNADSDDDDLPAFCPFCSGSFSKANINAHANVCLDSFGLS